MPDTPHDKQTFPTKLTMYEYRLIESALKYYGDTMPGYAAAAGLAKDEYAAVMVDVKAARSLRLRFRREPHDA